MSNYKALFQNSLNLKLTPISIRELIFIDQCPCDVYAPINGLFDIVVEERRIISPRFIKELMSAGHTRFFVSYEDRKKLIENHQDQLTNITRSLSIGNPVDNGKKHINLLAVNMSYLYEDPTNDAFLSIQLQSAKNLALFLIENYKIHKELFNQFTNQNHHYIFAQPFISSLFLIGILRQSHLYSDREIENLFITSYFKDIGMSAIPTHKYDSQELSDEDKKRLADHPSQSVKILQGRVPISPSHLKIIEGHHRFSLINNEIFVEDPDDTETVYGFETTITTVCDIIAAMISRRPYRDPTKLFDALDLIKALISDDHPTEFKLIVGYFRQFFSRP
jgi:hypothetical protein